MLDSVFTYTDADLSVSETEEADLIVRAQAGDDDATLTLLHAYGPAIRSAVSRFKGGVRDGQISRSHDDYGTASRSIEDVQSAALVAFLEVIADHDPTLNPRLAGRLVQRLNRELADEASTGAAFAVPERTLSRFYGILRTADGDVEEALSIVGAYGMSREVFLQILAAVQSDSIEGLTSESDEGGRSPDLAASPVFTPSPVVDVEDKILVEIALKSVTDEEARIVELAYGFTEYDPVPDAEIGHRMGLTRPTVQRKRGKALGTMRKTLGVTPEA